jgi:hypothetical protein
MGSGPGVRERDGDLAAGWHIQRGQRPLLEEFVVGHQAPGRLQVAERGELVPIDDLYRAGQGLDGLDSHRLQDLLVLDQAGMRDTVREIEAIDAEITVVWFIAEVAAVRKPFLARGRVPADAVVGPLPHAASQKAG